MIFLRTPIINIIKECLVLVKHQIGWAIDGGLSVDGLLALVALITKWYYSRLNLGQPKVIILQKLLV